MEETKKWGMHAADGKIVRDRDTLNGPELKR